jgi:branched-chain amino acid aminotransferase
VFVGSAGRLTTPAEASGCLLGVTRALLIELAPRAGVEIEEADLSPTALVEADEAFLTSSTREVHPVAHVDGHALPDAPGPLTAALATAFSELVASDPDP